MEVSQASKPRGKLLAVAVDRYLPPGLEFTNTPQKSRNSLPIDDLLFSSEDGEVLVKHTVMYVMHFLVGSGFHG